MPEGRDFRDSARTPKRGLSRGKPHANLPHPTPADAGATFSRDLREKGSRGTIEDHDLKPRIPEQQLDRARRMRREQTIAEEMLWRSLRNRQLGVKFRRQVPVGAFIADFACVEAKLIVEVDGPSHETEAGAARDAWRDRCLREMGWRVVRVANDLVTGGGDLALAPIRAVLER